jgi:hypothetical protein
MVLWQKQGTPGAEENLKEQVLRSYVAKWGMAERCGFSPEIQGI